jgi:hypothetical protein
LRPKLYDEILLYNCKKLLKMASNTPTPVINDKRFSPGTPFSSTNKTDSDKKALYIII